MTVDLKAPQNYSQLTEKQLKYVATLLTVGTPESVIWFKCFVKFTGIKPIGMVGENYHFKMKGLKKTIEATLEEWLSFTNSMKFLTKSYNGIKPLANIKHFVPCSALLEDVKFVQYLEAENYYQAYIFTQDEAHLDNLMSTLYGKKGKPYNNTLVEKNAIKVFRKCSKEEKLITFMWFVGVKEFFSKQYKFLFAPEKHNPIEGEPAEPKAPDMYAVIQNQVRALTNGDITKRDAVLNSLTWDALDELNEKVKESKNV